MRASIDIVGVEKLAATFERVAPEKAVKILRSSVTKISREIRDKVKVGAPVWTGRLEGAVKASELKGRKETIEAAVYVNKGRTRGDAKGAWYWHFVEFGTVQRAAAPFISPVVDLYRSKFPAMIAQALRSKLRRELKRTGRLGGVP